MPSERSSDGGRRVLDTGISVSRKIRGPLNLKRRLDLQNSRFGNTLDLRESAVPSTDKPLQAAKPSAIKRHKDNYGC